MTIEAMAQAAMEQDDQLIAGCFAHCQSMSFEWAQETWRLARKGESLHTIITHIIISTGGERQDQIQEGKQRTMCYGAEYCVRRVRRAKAAAGKVTQELRDLLQAVHKEQLEFVAAVSRTSSLKRQIKIHTAAAESWTHKIKALVEKYGVDVVDAALDQDSDQCTLEAKQTRALNHPQPTNN